MFYPTEICVEHDGLHGFGHWLCPTILLEFGDHRNGGTIASYGSPECKLGHGVPWQQVVRQHHSLQKGIT